MRAVVVLPTPRTPVRIQACGIRPVSNAFETVRTMASWPIKSSKLEGRYCAPAPDRVLWRQAVRRDRSRPDWRRQIGRGERQHHSSVDPQWLSLKAGLRKGG